MSVDLVKHRQAIVKAYEDVVSDKTSTDWMLLGYEGQTNVLKLVSSGDGGLEELAEDLNSTKVMYALVRVIDPKTTRTKLVLINWIGEASPDLRKGICSRHLPDVKAVLKGTHVTINARTEEEVEADQVFSAVSRATSTSYNFSDRAEIDEKSKPVGTNYQRTNPLSEINTSSRNQFWEQQEQEERSRKQDEIKRKQEEDLRLEQERKRREVQSTSERERAAAERNERIMAQRRATEAAETRSKALVSTAEPIERDETEDERTKRAELMRRQRKQEAESVIGSSTKSARSLFEGQQHICDGNSVSRPPPRRLKEFTPINATESNNRSNIATNSGGSRGSSTAVGRAWPPPSNSTTPPPQEERKIPHRMFEEPSSKSSEGVQPSVWSDTADSKKVIGRRQDPIGGNVTSSNIAPQSYNINNFSQQQASHKISSSALPQQQPAVIISSLHQQRTQNISSAAAFEASSVATEQKQTNNQQQQVTQSRHQEHRSFDNTTNDGRFSLTAQYHQKQQQQKQQHMSAELSHSLSSRTTASEFKSTKEYPENNHELSEQNPRLFYDQSQYESQQQYSPVQQCQSSPQTENQQKNSLVLQQQQYPVTHQVADVNERALCANDQFLSNGSNGEIETHGQLHVYDDVPDDFSEEDKAVSPGPASPHIESTPSVAMTYEVDGIEYQLLPEHGLCARALYDYQAADDTEISFDPSEIISNIEQIDEGWWQGVGPSGDFGLFPANYVELINAAHPHSTVVAR